jgi:phosphoglycolate phosphatase
MPFAAVLFDLDGTLLDTYEDIADSINTVLAEVGRPALPAELVKQYIGDGVDTLMRRSLGSDPAPELLANWAARFRQEYGQRWACKTHAYDGVVELTEALTRRGIRMGILSNKPDRFTQDCVARFLPVEKFDVVLGSQPGLPRKPDPAGARRAAERLRAQPSEILYLGDTATDMQTAVTAGMYAVGATWGYRSAEELQANGAVALIAEPRELLNLLNGT